MALPEKLSYFETIIHIIINKKNLFYLYIISQLRSFKIKF